jgi:hypothetical protein
MTCHGGQLLFTRFEKYVPNDQPAYDPPGPVEGNVTAETPLTSDVYASKSTRERRERYIGEKLMTKLSEAFETRRRILDYPWIILDDERVVIFRVVFIGATRPGFIIDTEVVHIVLDSIVIGTWRGPQIIKCRTHRSSVFRASSDGIVPSERALDIELVAGDIDEERLFRCIVG